MPVSYRFEFNIVVMDLVGEYTIGDFRQAILQALADPQKPAGLCMMINLTESQSIFQRTPEEVISMANFVSSLSDRFNHRIAFVASKDLPYGLMRMTSINADERGIQSAVFRTYEKAREWLLK